MALGLTLPAPSAPAFQYVPVVIHRDVAYVSGQLPRMGDGVVRTGKLEGRYRSSTPRTPHASASFKDLLVSSKRLEASIR
jgi:enamine deaminase RidA (YjgF/YER057c/UK114 family)